MSTLAHAVRGPLPLSRVVAVARVCYTRWGLSLGFPLAIMASSLAVNLLAFAAINDKVESPTSGGLASLYVMQLVVCWQGLHQNFGFAVGLNATRRSFYAAAVLVAVLQSLVYGVLVYLLAIIERATNGWGVYLSFFDPTHAGSASPLTILAYIGPLLFTGALGIFMGSIARRWGPNGVFVATIIAIVVIGGAVALVTFAGGWPAVGSWFTGQPLLALLAGWPLIPTVLMLAGGWLVLRRATP
jgi:hypothetical protein